MYLSKSMIFVFAIAQNMDMHGGYMYDYDDIMHRNENTMYQQT
jgi:hypothetical protein